MSRPLILAILSDPHYAGAAERLVGDDYEYRDLVNPWLRRAYHFYRHFIWLRHPLRQHGQLDRFLAEVGPVDYAIANGDYACSTGFIGLAHDPSFESARECVGKLRAHFGARLRLVCGDHEFGKLSLIGGRGGMRLAGWYRTVNDLGIEPFWRLDVGRYTLLGVTSSLIALPLLDADILPEEKPDWEQLRAVHLAKIRATFENLHSDRRILLFCHDPTALPFLAAEPAVRERLPQIEQTIIGHLHSHLYFWKSRMLAGMPVITRLGPSAKKMSSALNQAREWKPFRVRLCPSLAGIELLNDGGYYKVILSPEAQAPARFTFHPLKR